MQANRDGTAGGRRTNEPGAARGTRRSLAVASPHAPLRRDGNRCLLRAGRRRRRLRAVQPGAARPATISRRSSSRPRRSSTTAPARSSWRASGGESRQPVTFDEIPPILIDAATAIEDKTFWTNTGVDPVGIMSAASTRCAATSRGASTITQQLVRQRLLDPDLGAGSRPRRSSARSRRSSSRCA